MVQLYCPRPENPLPKENREPGPGIFATHLAPRGMRTKGMGIERSASDIHRPVARGLKTRSPRTTTTRVMAYFQLASHPRLLAVNDGG